MKKLATIALVPMFAGFLFAQADQQANRSETTTTTKTTTYNGTLVDAGCVNTHSEHRESSTNTSPDQSSTKTTTTHTVTDSNQCPVTTTTTTFGLMTPEGKVIRFDEPSNSKVIEVVKGNKAWAREMSDKKPIKVRVVGQPNGDVVVVESIK